MSAMEHVMGFLIQTLLSIRTLAKSIKWNLFKPDFLNLNQSIQDVHRLTKVIRITLIPDRIIRILPRPLSYQSNSLGWKKLLMEKFTI